jgi:hypothetical protein
VTTPATTARPVARRVGYAFGVAANAVLLVLVNRWPGWEELSFLTPDTERVLGIVNLSLAVGLAANLAYLVLDRPVVKRVGDLVTTAVGLAAMVRVWQVFPFDFSDYRFDATVLVRVLLVIGIVGSVIALVVALFSLGRRRGTPD